MSDLGVVSIDSNEPTDYTDYKKFAYPYGDGEGNRAVVLIYHSSDIAVSETLGLMGEMSRLSYLKPLLLASVDDKRPSINGTILIDGDSIHAEVLDVLHKAGRLARVDIVTAFSSSLAKSDSRLRLAAEASKLTQFCRRLAPTTTQIVSYRVFFADYLSRNQVDRMFDDSPSINIIVIPEDRPFPSAMAMPVVASDIVSFKWHIAGELLSLAGLWRTMTTSPLQTIGQVSSGTSMPLVRLASSSVRMARVKYPSLEDVIESSETLPVPMGMSAAPNPDLMVEEAADYIHPKSFRLNDLPQLRSEREAGPRPGLLKRLAKECLRFPQRLHHTVSLKLEETVHEIVETLVSEQSSLAEIGAQEESHKLIGAESCSYKSKAAKVVMPEAWHHVVSTTLAVADGGEDAKLIRQACGDFGYVMNDKRSIIADHQPDDLSAVLKSLQNSGRIQDNNKQESTDTPENQEDYSTLESINQPESTDTLESHNTLARTGMLESYDSSERTDGLENDDKLESLDKLESNDSLESTDRIESNDLLESANRLESRYSPESNVRLEKTNKLEGIDTAESHDSLEGNDTLDSINTALEESEDAATLLKRIGARFATQKREALDRVDLMHDRLESLSKELFDARDADHTIINSAVRFGLFTAAIVVVLSWSVLSPIHEYLNLQAFLGTSLIRIRFVIVITALAILPVIILRTPNDAYRLQRYLIIWIPSLVAVASILVWQAGYFLQVAVPVYLMTDLLLSVIFGLLIGLIAACSYIVVTPRRNITTVQRTTAAISLIYLIAVTIVCLNLEEFRPAFLDAHGTPILIILSVVSLSIIVTGVAIISIMYYRYQEAIARSAKKAREIAAFHDETHHSLDMVTALNTHWLGTAVALDRVIRKPYGDLSSTSYSDSSHPASALQKIRTLDLAFTGHGLVKFRRQVMSELVFPGWLYAQYHRAVEAYLQESFGDYNERYMDASSALPEECSYPVHQDEVLENNRNGHRWPFAHQLYEGNFDSALQETAKKTIAQSVAKMVPNELYACRTGFGSHLNETMWDLFSQILDDRPTTLPLAVLGEDARILSDDERAMESHVSWPRPLAMPGDTSGVRLIDCLELEDTCIFQAVRVDFSNPIRLEHLGINVKEVPNSPADVSPEHSGEQATSYQRNFVDRASHTMVREHREELSESIL